jgi:hypothetical protein
VSTARIAQFKQFDNSCQKGDPEQQAIKKALVNYLRPLEYGAGDGNRTRDRLITNQLLYRLSYTSE